MSWDCHRCKPAFRCLLVVDAVGFLAVVQDSLGRVGFPKVFHVLIAVLAVTGYPVLLHLLFHGSNTLDESIAHTKFSFHGGIAKCGG